MIKYLAFLNIFTAACLLGDNSYPSCSEGHGETISPPTPTTDPGPYLPPDSGDNFADGSKRYTLDAKGNVCECSEEQLGCVDSPEKAKKSAQSGAYCPFPRESGDPVFLGLVSGSNQKWDDTCTCFFTTEECGIVQLHVTTEVPGSSAEECIEWLNEQFNSESIQVIFKPKIQSCKPN